MLIRIRELPLIKVAAHDDKEKSWRFFAFPPEFDEAASDRLRNCRPCSARNVRMNQKISFVFLDV